MKVVYVGSFGEEWSTENYISRAMARAGCDVTRLDEKQTSVVFLEGLLKTVKPDLFLFTKCRLGGGPRWGGSGIRTPILLDRLRGLYGASACWMFDLISPEFSGYRWRWSRGVCEAADFFFTTDGNAARHLLGHGNPIVLRQGIGDDVRPGMPVRSMQRTACFLGSVYHGREAEVAALRDLRGEFAVIDNVRGAMLSDLMASVSMVIGPTRPCLPGYWSNRLYVVTGYGGLFVGPEVSGMRDEGWIPGEHYIASHTMHADGSLSPAYSSIVDFIREIKDAPHEMLVVRRAGQRLALAHHTYDHRVADLLGHVRKKLDERNV
jgi:hypothetical protein